MGVKLGIALVFGGALVVAGCAGDSPRASPDRGAGTEEPGQASNRADPVEIGGAPAPGAAAGSAPFDPNWTIEATGLGPIRIGMSVEAVVRALDGAVDVSEGLGGCDYVIPRGWPEGISVMVVQGRVARIEVGQGTIETTAGARVGMREQAVRALYPGQVEVRPHKYTEGEYLIVRPAGPHAADHRIVFETDGSVVQRYRAGVLPAVEWVEGCA